MTMRRGFTLLELLVVIAIVAVLAGLILPVLARARTSSKGRRCSSNLNQIGKALFMYADAPGNGGFPCNAIDPARADATLSLNLLYDLYIQDVRVFSCMEKPIPQSILQKVMRARPSLPPDTPKVLFSYGYDPGHKTDEKFAPLAADAIGNHGPSSLNVLFTSGTVEFKETPQIISTHEGKQFVDPDIYALNPEIPRQFDGYIRQ